MEDRYVKLTYFKNTGKYYCEGSYISKFGWDYSIHEEVKGMKRNGTLPDLASGRWDDGFILVSPDNDGVPRLID